MKCCRLLADGVAGTLPFERVVATGYHDGPTEGFTECSQCNQAYSFRKLDWDDLQDVRILGFAPLAITLDAIIARLAIGSDKRTPFVLVPPLPESAEKFVKELLAKRPTHVAAVSGWPARSPLWRDITGLNTEAVNDWFSFLGIPRKNA